MTTQYQLARDISGGICNTNAPLPCSITGFKGALAANVEQHISVPSNYKYWAVEIRIQANTTVYFDGINTAAVPAGALAAGTVEIIPTVGITRDVIAGQTLSFITAEAGGATITIKFYAKDTYANIM